MLDKNRSSDYSIALYSKELNLTVKKDAFSVLLFQRQTNAETF